MVGIPSTPVGMVGIPSTPCGMVGMPVIHLWYGGYAVIHPWVGGMYPGIPPWVGGMYPGIPPGYVRGVYHRVYLSLPCLPGYTRCTTRPSSVRTRCRCCAGC